ncbi:MAG: UDP-N-acetylmuramoyl-tripeptide--D-alanyl-D-alanine ligase [Candidatus Yanofskybacteria bacterium]|nr:UDP-N-acetylmuramoyl-tripeptide--D-alanyl-D-alanine ligase [Candidatus Yanofskybacteria bacterium]
MMKYFLAKILTLLAWAYVKRYKPQVIAITGNVGKTSTKEAVAAVLRGHKKIRVSGGNLNNEIGVPLTILGDWAERYYDQGGTTVFWLKVLRNSFFGLFAYDKNYPEVLIMEYGADRPGDIANLARNFKPNLAVVTAVGEVPVHVEYFSDASEVAAEKSKLVESLAVGDFAVLNFDDEAVLGMKQKTKAKVLTFGFGEGADVKISNFDFRIGINNEPLGVGFKLNHEENFVPVRIEGALGKSQAWAAGAATVVGLSFGMNLISISQALSNYRSANGRLKILKGVKNTFIIDDTYNSSPASSHLALETLKNLPAHRKIAVLADMLELGRYSVSAHQEVGNFAATFADLITTVGPGGKLIADAAGNQMPKDRIMSFGTAVEAKIKVQEILEAGDLILIKGSQGMRMERIVEEIMAEPERKKELLVRQSEKWLDKK